MTKRILVSLLCAVGISAYGQSISKYEYWVDYDADNKIPGTGSDGNINLSLDVSGLNNGIHFLCFHATDDKGVWSSPSTTMFLKVESVIPKNSILKYEYWIDYDQSNKTTVVASSEVVALNIDASNLNEGMHFLNFHVQDARGQWSAPQTTFFLKNRTKANALTQYEYWIDYDVANKQRIVSNNGIMNLSIDVDDLNDGMHFLCFRSQDKYGQWSVPSTTFFMKQQTGIEANTIVAYQYWVNDDMENMKSVSIDPQIPFVLETDLDLTCMNFMEGDNVLHVRFRDAMGRYSDVVNGTFVCTANIQGVINGTIRNISLRYSQGVLTITNGMGSLCKVYSINGQTLAEMKIEDDSHRVWIGNAKFIIVQLVNADGKTIGNQTLINWQ